ncbi:MAG: antirestriction protein ArdA [Nitrospiraceae bacterium]
MRDVSNREDMIDTRDVIERVDELVAAVEDLSIDEDEIPELGSLGSLLLNVQDVSGEDVEDGAGLIRDSYFETYAQELAEDIGAINKDATWPNNCIDWEQAARDLQMDYSSVDYGGVEYWVRS